MEQWSSGAVGQLASGRGVAAVAAAGTGAGVAAGAGAVAVDADGEPFGPYHVWAAERRVVDPFNGRHRSVDHFIEK